MGSRPRREVAWAGRIVLLRDICRDYVASRPALKPRSAEQLALAVRSLERHLGRPAQVGDLTGAVLARFMAAYLIDHAAATTNSKRRAILTLWRWARRQNPTHSMPAEVPIVKEPRRIPLAWTIDEIERLIATARQWPGNVGLRCPARLWWPSLFLAVYDTGCRVTALRSARSCNLSLAGRSLAIEPEATKTGVGVLYWLHDQTIAAIAGHYDAARELVWPWPYHRRTLWRTMRRIVERAGLVADKRGMSLFHKIRRSTISYCAAVSPALAQQQAGHSDGRTTARYVDPRIARQQSAVDVLPRPHF